MMSLKQPRWKAGDKVVVQGEGGDVYNIHALIGGKTTAVLFNLARKHDLRQVDANLLARAPQVSGRFRSVDVAVYVRGDETTYVCCNEEVQDCVLALMQRKFPATTEGMIRYLDNVGAVSPVAGPLDG